jgi:probable addiction module antidote protein
MTLKTFSFDIVDFIATPEDAVEYLKVVMEEGDSDQIRAALNNIVRARGVQSIAKETGLTRAAVYKALGEKGNPTLSTLLALTKALGVKLSVAA